MSIRSRIFRICLSLVLFLFKAKTQFLRSSLRAIGGVYHVGLIDKEVNFEQIKTLKHDVQLLDGKAIAISTCKTADTINGKWLGHPLKIRSIAVI